MWRNQGTADPWACQCDHSMCNLGKSLYIFRHGDKREPLFQLITFIMWHNRGTASARASVTTAYIPFAVFPSMCPFKRGYELGFCVQLSCIRTHNEMACARLSRSTDVWSILTSCIRCWRAYKIYQHCILKLYSYMHFSMCYVLILWGIYKQSIFTYFMKRKPFLQ